MIKAKKETIFYAIGYISLVIATIGIAVTVTPNNTPAYGLFQLLGIGGLIVMGIAGLVRNRKLKIEKTPAKTNVPKVKN